LQRRRFLASSLAASALALAGSPSPAQTTAAPAGTPNSAPSPSPRHYYQLRQYHLQTGPQIKLLQTYLEQALIPALNRLGMSPVGVFNLEIGPNTPTVYVLIPSPALEPLVRLDLHLATDEQFMRDAAPFWNAPAAQPAFLRIDSSLLIAFEGRPGITLPPPAARHGKRIFQLRTYESPTLQDHVRKVEMFHHGEFEIFERAGFWPIFYGDVLIGPRLPKLTYMLSFADLNDLNAKWDVFRNDPAWKKLSTSPRYASEPIVSNITNLVLAPETFSQI
jgi:hypothetical protein